MDPLDVVDDLSAQIKPLFAGKDPVVVGTVLADLLSTWVQGYVVPGDPVETAALRRQLLEEAFSYLPSSWPSRRPDARGPLPHIRHCGN